MIKLGSVLTIVVYLIVTASAFAASRTLTGIVTDTMCGQKLMIAGKSYAECNRESMKSKGSWTYGLAVGRPVYSLSGDAKQLASFAGKQAKVTGEQTGNNVAVQSITSAP
jgi:hypothetical protein